MSTIQETTSVMLDTAEAFFHACEFGEGWDACRQYCRPDATFSAQAGPLSDIDTVEEYTGWMQKQYEALPDAGYDLKSFAVDEDRNNVCACAVFRGTHTGEGGPVAPTGQRVESDYAYVMEFDGDKIAHVTKIWNAPFAMKQLGWM